MAIRIHVTAVRACPAEELRTTFTEILGSGFEAVPIHEHAGWAWFTTRVWGVGRGDLNKGLCRLARPALQFTTSGGDCWYLTVHGGPRGPEAFLHEFDYFSHPANPDEDDARARAAEDDDVEPPIDPDLAFLEDEPETSARPRTAFDEVADDLKLLGVPLPESLSEELRPLPYSQAINRLRDWHAGQVSRALADAGIPHDPEALRRVLLWETVTDQEQGSDLGNLPRLLAVLGLGGAWDEYVQRAEAPPVDDEVAREDKRPRPPDYAREVLDRVEARPLSPIEGGPVPLPPKRIARLGLPAEACAIGPWPLPSMAVRLILPPGIDRQSLPTPPAKPSKDVQALATADGFQFGLRNRLWFNKSDLHKTIGKALTDLLVHPPEGAVLEVDFALADEHATYHRYRGTVRDATVWIEQSYPRLSHETLAGAIEVAGFASKRKVRARDEAEAEALERAARRDNWLYDHDIKRKGLVVSAAIDIGILAKLLLRCRYPDAWDFGPITAHEAREYQERIALQKQMRRASVEAARRRAAPHDPEVLLKGRHTWYWRSDFLQLDQLDPGPRQTFDTALTQLGFTHVGDLVAKKQRDIVLRVFIAPDRLCYGILMGKRTLYLSYEFVSRLDDGSDLTTTTDAMAESIPKAGMYYRHFPGLDPRALYQKHLEGLNRFRTRKGTEPVALDGTLLGVAREIEIAYDRLEAANRP